MAFAAHALRGGHDVGLLRQEGVTELSGPLYVVRQPLDDIRDGRHRLDARIPWLFRDRIHQRRVLQAGVLLEPLLQLDDLQRIGGRDEGLRKQ